jgi:hypothetical protein
MKKLRRIIRNHSIFITSVVLTLVILVPLMSSQARPMTLQEFVMLDKVNNVINLTTLRAGILLLIIANALLVYRLLSAWFAKQRAGMSVFILSCMPFWLITQLALPRFTLILTPALIALWAFDRAGRATSVPAPWYALSGFAVSLAWLQEPVGITLLMVIGTIILLASKPRYVKHIARQSSLVLIILAVVVAAVSAASIKFNLGIQQHLIDSLTPAISMVVLPKVIIAGPATYHSGVPGVSLIPIAVMVLAGLGVTQLIMARKRPRNLALLLWPVLFGLASIPFGSMTSLMSIALAMIGIAVWAMMGVHYLYSSWRRIFPHNKLANSVGTILIGSMLASLALYSFWYTTKAWNGNPQTRIDATVEWDGRL